MLYEHWCRVAAERRNETALRDSATGRRWTFGELLTAGETWPVDAAPLVFPQGHAPEFLFALLAAWRAGKVVCPLEPGQSAPMQLVASGLRPDVEPGVPPGESERGVASDGRNFTTAREMLTPSPGGKMPPSTAARMAAATPHCVHLKTTSGSTGVPRFVAFKPEQLATDAENIMATMGLRADWPNLGVISMAHSYGFSNLVLPLLLHGIPLILVPTPLPELVRRAAESEPAITLAAVPALWRAWHEAGAIPPNVRLAISAGAPLPVRLEEAVFKAGGLKIHNFYGSSECGGIAYDDTDVPRTDETCVGAPMKNVSLSVAADGCLEVRSRAVGETYLEDGRWKMEDGKSPTPNLGDGCFRTSDLAEISDGHVYLRGRLGDQINVAGRKVSPVTIERVLFKHPLVSECLVFGVPSRDAERTEEIVAVVVSREREPVLRQFILESLPAWQVPRHWWFVEALQTNPRGKVSRAEWRAKYIHQRDQCV